MSSIAPIELEGKDGRAHEFLPCDHQTRTLAPGPVIHLVAGWVELVVEVAVSDPRAIDEEPQGLERLQLHFLAGRRGHGSIACFKRYTLA